MQTTLPKRHKAVVVTEQGKLTVQDDRPIPTLESGEVLVKVVATAINPVDAKMLDYSPAVGSVAGDVRMPALPSQVPNSQSTHT
jgi:NADPH:quinone reductase-like Zn-dependent oxidoreductase